MEDVSAELFMIDSSNTESIVLCKTVESTVLLYVGSQKVKGSTVQMRRDNQRREKREVRLSQNGVRKLMQSH